jgi:predicted ATPase/DNA-binding SARP family transcriptional activator
VEFRLLGPLEVRAGGRVCALGGAKQRAVLALLLLHANEVVSSDRLIDELWGERPPKTAQTTLQVYVSRLRKALPAGVLERREPGYLVLLAPEQLDLRRCEALLHEGRQALAQGEAARALKRLEQALGLWRGPPLADFAFASFAQAAIGRLEELRLACLEERIEAELALGRHPELAGELEALVEQQPLRERLHAQRLLALYRSGRQAEALAAYQQARRLLVDELGIEPSPALQRLEQQILNQDEALEWTPPSEPEPPATNLPAPATPLVGRERELAEAGELLRAHRLLTLTGAGGSGKTRLALELAALASDRFSDGTWFVNLAPIADPDLVVATIAQTLGLRPAPGGSIEQTLAVYLSTRELLLVLDNFEQVIEAAAGMAELLAGSAALKLLLTSREPLHLQGEHEYAVPPLAGSEAVALFLERARAVKPAFELAEANAAAVAEICVRLDGLPLALELAAARAKVLSPQAMLERLEYRLPLLTGGARDLPERQRTLSAAIDWSYQLLEQEERQLYARLGVFVGGCTLETAEAVCDAELDDLASLVDKSLLRREGERFTMLETIREHALERLEASGEAEEQRRRHAERYLDLAERAEPELRGPEQGAWFDRLEADLPNFRSCLAWALASEEVELALRLATALWQLSLDRAQALWREETRWLEEALAKGKDVPSALRARALYILGMAVFYQGHYHAATRAHEEALSLFRKLDDEASAIRVLNRLGSSAWALGETDRAQRLCREALALSRRLGDKRGEADSLMHLGDVARDVGDLRSAAESLESCIRIMRELGDHLRIAGATHSLGDVALEEQDWAAALELYRESLALTDTLGDKRGNAYCLAGLAGVAASVEEIERAGRLWGAVEAGEDELGVRLLSVERARYERLLAPCAGDPAFEKGVAEGRSLGLARAVEEELGHVALTR